MCRVLLFAALMLLVPAWGRAGALVDATGRSVALPAHIARVLPAGPPAAALLAALAPDLMIGWPSPLTPAERAALPPALAALPQVPRLTGRDDAVEAVRALAPDLIVDYGTVSPAYAGLARHTQERLGVPDILLDGSLAETPRVLRALGAALGRSARAEMLSTMAEGLLALPRPAALRVAYARGPDGTLFAAPDTGATEGFAHLGWQVLAPPGDGWFHRATPGEIAALDPDLLIFADGAVRARLASPDWQAVRAVREGHVRFAPALPFGWVEDPPSLNRLLGVAWLSGGDAATLAATFAAAAWGQTPSAAELAALRQDTP